MNLFILSDNNAYDTWKRTMHKVSSYYLKVQAKIPTTVAHEALTSMETLLTKDRWLKEWQNLLGSEILPGYHNFGHMIDVYEQVAGLPVAYQFAALYHDIFYVPSRSNGDNIKAANEAVYQDLKGIPVLSTLILEIQANINTTGSHFEYPLSPLVKADLSILIQPSLVYDCYATRIREEHISVSDTDYAKGRSNLLKRLVHNCVKSQIFREVDLVNPSKEATELSLRIPPEIKSMTALYAGTFDPFHKGHLHIVREALDRGLKVVVCILPNPTKKPVVGESVRAKLIRHDLLRTLGHNAPVKVEISTGIGDTLGTMAELGCSVLLRGVRKGDAASELEEKTRASLIKAETGVESIIIPTQGHISSYSSSSAKMLISLGYPARMLSSLTRAVYCDQLNYSIVLLVGGIASGKSTYAKKVVSFPVNKSHYIVDLDDVAKKYLSLHEVYSRETPEQRREHFRNMNRYRKYMSRVKPVIMAGLHQEISLIRRGHTDSSTFPTKPTILVLCNKLGLLWDELLRMSNYNILYMKDIPADEALRRVNSRGSSVATLEAVLKLEGNAPNLWSLRAITEKKINALEVVGLDRALLSQYQFFNVKEIPQ